MGLVYLDTTQSGTPTIPPWLDGWEPPVAGNPSMVALCHRDARDLGHLVGVGKPLTFTGPRPDLWRDLGDGWKVANVGGFDPADLLRTQLWFSTAPAVDLNRREWSVPIILDRSGKRAFRVAYGRDWLPALSKEQERAIEIATSARDELTSGEDSGLDMPVACQWAAEFLSLTHHITPGVIAALGLMDDVLAVSVLAVATSLPLAVEAPGDE